MDIASLVIPLLSGAAGGNIAGAVLKKFSLGGLGNTIVGILGGGIGSQVLAMLGKGAATGAEAAANGSGSTSAMLSSVLSGGLGGQCR